LSWYDIGPTPITSLHDGPVSRRLFDGKLYALTFLADGSLVIGTSRGLRRYDAQTGEALDDLFALGALVGWCRIPMGSLCWRACARRRSVMWRVCGSQSVAS
jgi:hypothetical protein